MRCSTSWSVSITRNLDRVRRHDGEQQPWVASVHLGVSREVAHLNAVTLSTDKSCLPKNTHVQGERGLWDRLIEHTYELGAVARAFPIQNFYEQRRPNRFSQCMQDRVERNIFDSGMDQRLHLYFPRSGVPKMSFRFP